MSDTTMTPPAPPTPMPRRAWWRPTDRMQSLRWAAWAGLAVLMLVLPLYLDPSYLRVGQYIMIGAIGAIGLTMLTGQAGQLSLGHAFFLLAGGTFYCVLSGEEDGLIGLGLPPVLAMAGAVIGTALLGLAFAPVAGRVRGIYLGIATLSLVYLGLYLGQELTDWTGGTASGRSPADFEVFGFSFVRNDPEITIAGVPMTGNERLWYLFLILLTIGYVLAQGAVRGRPGRSWRAIRDNESAAAAVGVPVRQARTGAFAVSSAYAGLAGVMTVLWFDLLKPDESEFAGTYSIVTSIAFLAMVIIGGLGSVPGAVFGSMLVYGFPKILELEAGSSDLFGGTVGGGAITPVILTAFIYGLAIILVVLFEPGGIAAIGRRLLAAAQSLKPKGQ